MDKEARIASLHGIDDSLLALFVSYIVLPCRQTDGNSVRREVGNGVAQRRGDEGGRDWHG